MKDARARGRTTPPSHLAAYALQPAVSAHGGRADEHFFVVGHAALEGGQHLGEVVRVAEGTGVVEAAVPGELLRCASVELYVRLYIS